jgi:hypothetical protein
MVEGTRQVTIQMEKLVREWEVLDDQRTVFLSCYLLMTQNMVRAIDKGEFRDPEWVDGLLRLFAGYYFDALSHFERDSAETPAVWQLTFEATRNPDTMVMQNLFLGVNAHINYDLVLTLRELLEPEWSSLSESERHIRYLDHCKVNDVIGRTVDSVQEQVIEDLIPAMDVVDKIFGPLDEKFTAWLIGRWRDEVWEQAIYLIEAPNQNVRVSLQANVENEALKKARLMLLR